MSEPLGPQNGAAGVPLPSEPAAGQSPEPADLDTLDERRRLGSELALQAANRRAAEAQTAAQELRRWISELERSLQAARREPERLIALLAERERSQRIAEQQAHAERARRLELDEQLAAVMREREAVADRSQLAAYALRVRELEQELTRLRRRADEAEHAARAALAAQRGSGAVAAQRGSGAVAAQRGSGAVAAQRGSGAVAAQRGSGAVAAQGAQTTRPARSESVPAGFRAELDLRRRSAPAIGEAALLYSLVARDAELLRRERLLIAAAAGSDAGAEQTVAALRRELEARTLAEASLRAALAAREARPPLEPVDGPQLVSTLAQLRIELDGLRVAVEREAAARIEAQRRATARERDLSEHAARSVRAHDAIEQLRRQLTDFGAAAREARSEPDAPAGPVDPERFAAALWRLRQATPPTDAAAQGAEARPEAAAGPWLERAFRALTRTDPESAGQLLLALLPVQALVHPDPLAYDLVLAGAGCVRVTVAGGSTAVELESAPREPSAVQLQLIGELPGIARLIVAGRLRRRLRRRFGRRLAKIRGDRARLSALTALLRAPLGLLELLEAGVQIDPPLMLVLAAAMIEPAWSGRERFALAYEWPDGSPVGPYLQVRDGSPAAVSESRLLMPVTTTIVCSPEALPALLAGERVPDATIRGEQRPVALLQDWLARAQRA